MIYKYNLHNIMDVHGYVHVEIRKGVYELNEASIIAYKILAKNIKPNGYSTVEHIPGLWPHNVHRTTFTLDVDDFGIKFFTTTNTDHIITKLKQKNK